MTPRHEQYLVGGRISLGSGEDAQWLFICVVLGFAAVCGAAIGVLGGLVVAILSAILAAAVVTLVNYRVGLWFMIILLPFASTHLIPRKMLGVTGLNPLNVIIAGTIVSLVLAWMSRPKDFALPRLPYLWWLYVLPISLAAFHGTFYYHEVPAIYGGAGTNDVTSYLQEAFVKPATIVVVAILTAIAARNIDERFGWQLVPVFVAASLVALIIPIYVAITDVSALFASVGKSQQFGSVVGMHANELGLLLNTAFALSLFTWIETRQGVVKTLLVVVMAIASVTVALTFSRGAYLGWLIVVAYLLVTRRRIAWLLGTVVVMAVVFAIMPPEIVERAFLGIQDRDVSRVSSGRVYEIWLPLLPTLLESPLFGHGLNSVAWAEPVRRGVMSPVGHAHNAYLGLVLDLGIVGAVLVWMFWFRLWQEFRALARELNDPALRGYFEGASVCILILLVQGVTDDRFTPTGSQSFIWVSAGIAFGLLGRSSTHMASTPSR
jgi:hypothetical protein